MASRAFRARPLDVNKPLDIVTDMSLLDNGGEGLPARDVVHNHAALDAENEKVGARDDFGRGDARWGACGRAHHAPVDRPPGAPPARRRTLCSASLRASWVVTRRLGGHTCGKPPFADAAALAAVVVTGCRVSAPPPPIDPIPPPFVAPLCSPR